DMVGHTGNVEATIKGVEAADKAKAMVWEATLAAGGVMLMTADHGNGEEVLNVSTGKMDKEHSTNPIPFLIIGAALKGQTGPTGDPPGGDLSQLPPVGMLADVAPTMLKFLEIPQPEEMTGQALI
ncbi:MAG: 2,3-bisphosphoglycerate-independent phosphoglycerate mutase, partial [Patescibacteria group bacterium]